MKRIHIFLNEYPESRDIAQELCERFTSIGMEVNCIESPRPKAPVYPGEELNIVVGGDGTFLKAVRDTGFSDTPFIGINTGHLGFFQEVEVEEITAFVHAVATRRYMIEPLRLLEAATTSTEGKERRFLCVNEVLVKGIRSKVLHLSLYLGDFFLEKFSGDGLIVSTSIGSTAYNFSVGGAVVHPALEIMQIAPLAPISSAAYRSLGNAIITPGDIDVVMEPETTYDKDILLLQDGVEHRIPNIEQVRVHLAERYLYRLHLERDVYWRNLRDKFIECKN